jgi:hypothetical protein
MMKNNVNNHAFSWKMNITLSVLGLLGVVSLMPVVEMMVTASAQDLPVPISIVQLASFVQSSILLVAMVCLGAWLSPKVNLGAPIVQSFVHGQQAKVDVTSIVKVGIAGGIFGGLLIVLISSLFYPMLPQSFVANAQSLSLPFYTKLLYSGITEEILIRWGLMTFFVWAIFRLTQKESKSPKNYHYVFGILVTAILFGLGHLPAAYAMTNETNVALTTYILLGNASFGIVAGYLYWRKGLESAIVAHMVAHAVMFTFEYI